MSDIYSTADYMRDPFLVTSDLANHLRLGLLSVFLGAGVSAGFGLPQWSELVARVLGRGDDEDLVAQIRAESGRDTAKRIDDVDDASEHYIGRIHSALYQRVPEDLERHLSKSPLLLAVAALVSGSIRGRVEIVTSYNYDDVLENYLRMLGYGVSVRTSPDNLSTRADVVINHPHGYIPRSEAGRSRADSIILSERSYGNRRSSIGEGWAANLAQILMSKIGLFIGLSGDDSAILDQIRRAGREIGQREDYLGYWLMTPSAFDRNGSSIKELRMCPIKLDEVDYPRFVFEVCKKAMT